MHRRICFLLVIVALLIFSRPGVHAGTPHTAYGKVQYSNGTHSASISFSAYVTTRSLEILTQSSAGCQYAPATGDWVVQCGSFTTSWAIGDVLHIDFNDGAGGSGSDDVILTSNPYDDAGTTVLFVPPVNYQITITTGTASLKFVTDGTEYTGSHTFTWPQGSSHPISVNSPQSGAAGTRYIFQSWSDGGVQSHSYTVPGTNETLTAYFKIQHELVVMSGHGNPQGAGWYDAGSIANFGISSPEAGSTGTRYVFTGWTGSGSGSYTGADAAKSVTLNNPVTETAGWKTQYRLTTAENPDAGGNMTPVPPGGYYDEGSSVSVDATVALGYTWSGWSGDLIGTTKPTGIIMNGPKSVTANFTASPSTVQITVATRPTGREFFVDGTSYTSTQVFTWIQGSSHTVSVNSPQSVGAGARYVFQIWSDGGVQSHSYTVPGTNETLTAYFKIQHELVVMSGHGNPQGAGWYDAGSIANFGISSPEAGSTGTRYVFTGWTGSGSGSYTGADAAKSVTLNNPVTETAGWKTQYRLTTAENPDAGGNMTPVPPGGYYDAGTVVTVDASVAAGYAWAGWSGDLSGTVKPGNVTVSLPRSVTANFTALPVNVQITVQTDPGGKQFTVDGVVYTGSSVFGWVPGSLHSVSVNSSQSGAAGMRYVFVGWSDGGVQNHSYTVPGTNETLTVHFRTQYELVVVSGHGNPEGAGWYDAGTTAAFSLRGTEENGNTRWLFSGWSGDYTGMNTAGSILMNQAKTLYAGWKTQYKLNVVSPYGNPQGGGWYDSGTKATFSIGSVAETGGTRHVFNCWTGSYYGIEFAGTLTVNEPKSVQAIWYTQHFLSISVYPASCGTISPDPPGIWIDDGNVVTLRASAGSGCRWYEWTGDLSGDANPAFITMNGPKSVTGNFSTTSIYRVTTDPPGQVIYVDGSDYISPCDFPWAYETTHSVGVDSLVSRESGIRHVFQSWSDGGARTHQVIADAILIFTATIPAQCYLTISTSPDSGGTVLPPPPGVWMNRGMVATLFAVPKTSKGYGFTGWSGDRTGISNPDTLVMNGPRRVSATFTVQSYAITLQTDPVDGGSIVKIPAKGIYRSGETLLLQAVPKTGYVFEFWSGDAAGSANPTYATMNGNKTVVAHFKQAGTVVTPETKNIPDPSEFALEQNYPNPFNPKTLIRFRIPEAERVSIQVFNSMGEKVRTLINETKNPGGYQVLWDGMSDSGQQLSAGTYLIVLQAGDQILRKKSVFIK